EQAVAVAEHQQHFRLVVGLAERARGVAVVDLPARALGVGAPQVAVVAEQVLGELGLEAELELGLERVQLERPWDRVARVLRPRLPVHVGGPERRQQVDRLVGAEIEGAELGVLRQFPAAVQQRAAAGVGEGGAMRLLLVGEQRAAFVVGVFVAPRPAPLPPRAAGGADRLARLFGTGIGIRRVRGAAPHRRVVAGQAIDVGFDMDAGGRIARPREGWRGGQHAGQHEAADDAVHSRGSSVSSSLSSACTCCRASSSWASMSRLTEVSAGPLFTGSGAGPGPASPGTAGRARTTCCTVWGSEMPVRANSAFTRRMASLRTLPRSLWRWSTQPKKRSTIPAGPYSSTDHDGPGSARTPSTPAICSSASPCATR